MDYFNRSIFIPVDILFSSAKVYFHNFNKIFFPCLNSEAICSFLGYIFMVTRKYRKNAQSYTCICNQPSRRIFEHLLTMIFLKDIRT